jgi:hypothetical protein
MVPFGLFHAFQHYESGQVAHCPAPELARFHGRHTRVLAGAQCPKKHFNGGVGHGAVRQVRLVGRARADAEVRGMPSLVVQPAGLGLLDRLRTVHAYDVPRVLELPRAWGPARADAQQSCGGGSGRSKSLLPSLRNHY